MNMVLRRKALLSGPRKPERHARSQQTAYRNGSHTAWNANMSSISPMGVSAEDREENTREGAKT
jgi:hypothetical protein